VGDRYPGRGVEISVRVWCAGLREVVRYVVRLREVMEIVRRCKLTARLGIVNRVNKAGCVQSPPSSWNASSTDIPAGRRPGKNRKESDEMKTLASSNLLMRHGDSLEPRVQDGQVESNDRCKAAAARSA
jgi:hypothetical protein